MHWKPPSCSSRLATLALACILVGAASSSDLIPRRAESPPAPSRGTDPDRSGSPRLKADARLRKLWLDGAREGTRHRLSSAPGLEGPWREIGFIGGPDRPFQWGDVDQGDTPRFFRVEDLQGDDGDTGGVGTDPNADGSGRDWEILMEGLERSEVWKGSAGIGLHGADGGFSTVSVSSTAAAIPERNGSGGFVLRRTPPLDQALQVSLELRGSAANGGDYRWIPNSATFPRGGGDPCSGLADRRWDR